MMFADKPWLQIVVFFVVAVPVVAILTRLTIWLAYCFKAAPDRSGSEEMALADWTNKLKEGVKPYSSYEEWRQDVRSNKPLDEILGRVPPGFFDKKPEPAGTQGLVGANGPAGIVGNQGPQGSWGAVIYPGLLGPQDPQCVQGAQGAQAANVARQRLAEIQKRIKAETNQASKRQLEQFRAHMDGPTAAQFAGVAPWMPDVAAKAYCQHCNGTGYVGRSNMPGILTGGVPCPVCKK